MSFKSLSYQEGLQIDLFSSEFKKDAYLFYESLRVNNPVFRFSLPSEKTAWLITRYDDAIKILKDNQFIKDPYKLFKPKEIEKMFPNLEKDLLTNHMLNSDPPNHTRLRKVVHTAFSSRTVKSLRRQIEDISQDLIDKVEYKGEMDIIDDFAFPLPIAVIGSLLGVPESDYKVFRKWSNTLVEASNFPSKMKDARPEFQAFSDYLQFLIMKRKEQPKNDLISKLIYTKSEEDQLTQQEICSMIFLLIIAGHETTVNLIGNGILALLQFPEQLEKLKSNFNLIDSAVEELLRFYSPVELATNRWASKDLFIRDKLIRKGDMIVVSLASANRDELKFFNPECLDISRSNNHHLAFGMGIHYCLGAPLARLEGKIAINTVLKRVPNIRLNADLETLSWRPTYLMRGLGKLPVIF
ncbi:MULTISPECIES: cytochrome P450 family protein [Bacillus cereus group]|uniref:cytochrome P450 family protein n=2 Tax=Bacillus TaxID=1386 RepID=UPI0011455630|nr:MULTISPECIES: cytochrome P450 [Bacillus cereus group]